MHWGRLAGCVLAVGLGFGSAARSVSAHDGRDAVRANVAVVPLQDSVEGGGTDAVYLEWQRQCSAVGGSGVPGWCPIRDCHLQGAGCASGFSCDVSGLCVHNTVPHCLACAVHR